MKLISWNVNGIRAVHRKEIFLKFIEDENPDILCLQETKAHAFQLPEEIRNVEGYESFFNEAEKKGYSGTAVYTKVKPLTVTYGIDEPEHDKEGRVITAEFEDFFLINVYVPNSKPELARLEYRQMWDEVLLKYMKSLEVQKPVILCGDLNVAHHEIDLARPKTNHFNPGFSDEERAGMGNFVQAGFLDTFREFDQSGDNYTWWSYRMGARARNVGWRIDYFLISTLLRERLEKACILDRVMGSDHCPVTLELKI